MNPPQSDVTEGRTPEASDIGKLVDSLDEPSMIRTRDVTAVAARAMEEMVELCLAAGLNSGAIMSAVVDALANQAIKQSHEFKRTVYPSEIDADTSIQELAGEVADVRLLLKDLLWVCGAEAEAHQAELRLMTKLLAAKTAGELYLDHSGTMRRKKAHVLGGQSPAGTEQAGL